MRLDAPRVVVATHATELTGQSHALREYLLRRGADFAYVEHPLPGASLTHSTLARYAKGERASHRAWRDPKALPLAAYARHYLLSRAALQGTRGAAELFVGVDPLNALAGLALRRRGRVAKVAYWSIDYTPRRFGNPVLNRAYHALDRHVARRVDVVWSISRRIADVREAQGVPPERSDVVPIGIDHARIPSDGGPRDPDLVAFMGHLVPSKGCDELLEAMALVRRERPTARLEVVGAGPHAPALHQKAEALGLGDGVRFRGVLEYGDMMRWLTTASIAVAPYADDPDSITRFADPAKPKEYLACGLPVVITDVPWIAEEIGKRPMGIVAPATPAGIAAGILRLLGDAAFQARCRENALAFTSGMTWDAVFDAALGRLGVRV